MTIARTQLPRALAAGGLAAGLAAGLAGCIDAVDGGGAPMCHSTDDCDSGEVCDEGVCWGNPPSDVAFAAVLVPPPERGDLPLTAVASLSIAGDGTISGLRFPEAIRVHGRVLLACPQDGGGDYDCGPEQSVGATVLVERAASFPGGPTLRRTITATAGVGPGQDAFSFLVPKDPSAEIRVTITPDDSAGGEEISPGELAPPRQIVLAADADQAVEWTLGDPADLKAIRGCVQNLLGNGADYAGMQVSALGRWTELSPLVRASSRSVTDAAGCFALRVPIKMLDTFDIVVKPPAGAILPTLRLYDEFVRDPSPEDTADHWIDPLVMPSAPSPTTFRLPVEAQGSAGGQVRVPGAAVRFETRFEPPPGELRHIDITFTAEAVTSDAEADSPGVATVQLYPGSEQNRIYTVQVVPPPDAQVHSAFGLQVPVGIGGSAQLLEAVTLGRRVALTGVAVARSGQPVVGAPVTADASSVLQVTLDQEPAGLIIDQLQFPVATTDQDGGFLVWVDRQLVGESASYDIEIQPPAASGAPSWTFEGIAVPSEGDALDLGELTLPEASYARGPVRDAAGERVAGAELHLYQLPADDFCMRLVEPSGATCNPPAQLRGIWASDADGTIRIVLPDP